MDNPVVVPQTCVLKMKLHCEKCQRNVKKLLQKIHGVYSISIDADQGTVTVSGTVDPYILITMLGKAGKRAELLLQQKLPMNNHHCQLENQFKNMKIAPTQPMGIGQQRAAQIAQLQRRSQMEQLKHVELTQSRGIKMSFKGHKAGLSHECDHCNTHNYRKIIMDGVHAPSMQNEMMNGPHPPLVSGGGGNHCGACQFGVCPTQYGGGHVMNNISHGCHPTGVTCCTGPSRVNLRHVSGNVGLLPVRYYAPRQRPPGNGGPPLAPYYAPPEPPGPASYYAPPVPQPVTVPYGHAFSDDNPNSCIVM